MKRRRSSVRCALVTAMAIVGLAAPACRPDRTVSVPENPDFVPATLCLPTIRLTTNDEEPILSRDHYVRGRVSIDPVGIVQCALASARMEIRGRGNSSWGYAKKSYTLVLDEEAALCGFPAARKWVLLANLFDKSLMRDKVGFELSERFGLYYTPRSQLVELFLNGRYDGVYQLTEKIEIGEGRVDLAAGGVLLEADYRDSTEIDLHTSRGTSFIVQDPEGLSAEEMGILAQYLNKTEDALFSESFEENGNSYTEYLDTFSFLRWGLVNEIMRNVDAIFESSCFLYRPAGGNLFMGPVWDFDIAAGNANYHSGDDPEGWTAFDAAWLKAMFADAGFRQELRDTWLELKAQQIDTMPDFIDEAAQSLECAQKNNFQRWLILDTWVWPNAVVTGSYQGEVDYLKEWLLRRIAWMDSQLTSPSETGAAAGSADSGSTSKH